MNPLLHDLYGHQVWADAEHWRAIEGHPPAAQDPAIRNRLHHIHWVQRAFLWAVGDRRTAPAKPDDFPLLADLKHYGRGYHDEISRYLETVTDERLNEGITMPWFKDPPLSLTVTQALMQCAMHSHYHRDRTPRASASWVASNPGPT